MLFRLNPLHFDPDKWKRLTYSSSNSRIFVVVDVSFHCSIIMLKLNIYCSTIVVIYNDFKGMWMLNFLSFQYECAVGASSYLVRKAM